MAEAFIVGGWRTPIGSYGGQLSTVRPDDLAAHVIRATLSSIPSADPTAIGDVVFGCANQAGEDNRNVARMAGLLAGLPASVAGQTINRLCASGLSAVIEASRAIRLGEAELMLAGGVESMSRAPWVMGKPTAAFARNPEVFDTTLGWRFVNPKLRAEFGTDSMGETAENVASELQLSRDAQDRFALASQNRATSESARAFFAGEIAPVIVDLGRGKSTTVSVDEFPRADASIEGLSKLKPAFRTDGSGSVTAGNSSGINDGAACLMLASEAAIKKYQLSPLARVVTSTVAGVAPRTMGLGPAPAIQALLTRTGLQLSDIGLFELNEAFAAQVLGVCSLLKISGEDPRINPYGGAIALGHPLGMSGARLALTAARQLAGGRARYAICSMCVGVGQGVALLVERV